MGWRKKNIIGVDLGRSVVKMVEYSRVQKHVTTIAKLFLDPGEWKDEAALGGKIKKWLSDKKQAGSAELVAAIPGEYAVIRYVDILPGDSNPTGTISWELAQYLSSPVSEYLFDFQKLDEGDEHLVAAYRRSEVEKIQRLLESRAMPLTVVDVDVFATLNAFEINYPEYSTGDALIIKADLHGISCINTKKSRFLGHHFISIPNEFIVLEESQRTQMLVKLIQKIDSIISNGDSAETNKTAAGRKILYCGDLAADPEFCSLLKSSVSVPAERLNAFNKVLFPHDAEYAEKVLETAPQCATALGLAMRFRGDAE